MKLLQQSEWKLGWKSTAIAFFLGVTSISPGLLSLQKFVKFQSWDVTTILTQKVEKGRFEHQTAINHHLTDIAEIGHDDDDIGRKGKNGLCSRSLI